MSVTMNNVNARILPLIVGTQEPSSDQSSFFGGFLPGDFAEEPSSDQSSFFGGFLLGNGVPSEPIDDPGLDSEPVLDFEFPEAGPIRGPSGMGPSNVGQEQTGNDHPSTLDSERYNIKETPTSIFDGSPAKPAFDQSTSEANIFNAEPTESKRDVTMQSREERINQVREHLPAWIQEALPGNRKKPT